MRSSDVVVVVGGGVIGLSIAYVLAREGIRATIVERDEIGRGASWAGAGMIPPFTERRATSPINDLRSWSAVLYREWSAALLEATGVDNGYRKTGGLDVAATPAEMADLKTAAGRWRVEGITFEPVDSADFARFDASLNPALIGGYFLPDRAQIRNPRHLRALQAAVTQAGVTLQPRTSVVDMRRQGERITAVETETGAIACDQVILAAGAWSGELGRRAGIRLQTPPLKGQIVLFRADRDAPRRIIERGKNYLVPRGDGRVLMGATEEDVGFDTRSTAQAIGDLIDQALFLCPGLATAEVERCWAGLRPGSIDTRPYIGRVDGIANLIVATGHKRAGIQLAPATAEVVADLIRGRSPRIDLAPFAPGRIAAQGDDLAFRS
jgi:glycine oxidase